MPVVHNSTTPEEDKDEWRTDPVLFHLLNKLYHFNLDVAASKENTLCKRYFTQEYSALDHGWWRSLDRPPGIGTLDPFFRYPISAWCNPPFSLKAEFLQKGWEEYLRHDVKSCFLVPGDAMETGWWRNAVYDTMHPIGPNLYQAKAQARILHPRVNFYSPDMKQKLGNNRPSALIFYGWDQPHGVFYWDWKKTAIEAGILVKKGRVWVLRDDLMGENNG